MGAANSTRADGRLVERLIQDQKIDELLQPDFHVRLRDPHYLLRLYGVVKTPASTKPGSADKTPTSSPSSEAPSPSASGGGGASTSDRPDATDSANAPGSSISRQSGELSSGEFSQSEPELLISGDNNAAGDAGNDVSEDSELGSEASKLSSLRTPTRWGLRARL